MDVATARRYGTIFGELIGVTVLAGLLLLALWDYGWRVMLAGCVVTGLLANIHGVLSRIERRLQAQTKAEEALREVAEKLEEGR